jgi:hypothetical protein
MGTKSLSLHDLPLDRQRERERGREREREGERERERERERCCSLAPVSCCCHWDLVSEK